MSQSDPASWRPSEPERYLMFERTLLDGLVTAAGLYGKSPNPILNEHYNNLTFIIMLKEFLSPSSSKLSNLSTAAQYSRVDQKLI